MTQLCLDLWNPTPRQAALLDAIREIENKPNCVTACRRLNRKLMYERLIEETKQ